MGEPGPDEGKRGEEGKAFYAMQFADREETDEMVMIALALWCSPLWLIPSSENVSRKANRQTGWKRLPVPPARSHPVQP